jgi:DNA-binding response OmpR family regulator
MSALDAFVVHMRHELRNPVSAILGYSQLLLDEGATSLGASERRDLQRVEESGRQLLRIIGEVLDPEVSPGADISLYAVRLRHAMRTPITSVQGYVELLLEGLDGSPMADDLRRIHLAATRLVELSDGIERLYWVRAEGATDGPLPSSPEAARAAAVLDAAPESLSGGGTVLVIDDEEVNRALLARRLAGHGHRVLLAASGEEGLSAASSHAVDVILLDIVMPGLSGYEVLGLLKSDDALRELPVLMITALDDPASVVRCVAMGADDYLSKPFDPLLLRARVSSCLTKKRARDLELAYLRVVATVTAAAASVASGSFEPASLDEVARRPDALGNLARLFQRMGAEVAARELRLKEQVRQLAIEIDERKKAAQVAEITESDYFRGLQERVRDLSARRSGGRRGP